LGEAYEDSVKDSNLFKSFVNIVVYLSWMTQYIRYISTCDFSTSVGVHSLIVHFKGWKNAFLNHEGQISGKTHEKNAHVHIVLGVAQT